MSTNFWLSGSTWIRSASNTTWCLAGCSIGDLGTIAFFQFTGIAWQTLSIMLLAIINGLITSIALETAILKQRGMSLKQAFHTAMGMSFLSMIAMEAAMNGTDWVITGGARLTWQAMPFILIAGFLTPLPYNYWRLKKTGKSCH